MTIAEALKKIRQIQIRDGVPEVFETAARALSCATGAVVVSRASHETRRQAGVMQLLDAAPRPARALAGSPARIVVRLREDGSGVIAAPHSQFLFAAVSHLIAVLGERDVKKVAKGLTLTPAFSWNRPSYDLFLTQEGRFQHGLNRESYVRRLAECGFTHVEVNALASQVALEHGMKGEAFSDLYSCGPSLDQFVCSCLNKGLYPFSYLSANLARLKDNAALACRYGLVPGLLSYEPRSVPEEFFTRYPMLRGARVDHPFLSLKPRYAMTVAHPLVRAHYAEMMSRLLHEVPELGYVAIWTNDSGAGFERAGSLAAGRNGGPYTIRERPDDAEAAKVSGGLALEFFRLLRDAAREVNPDFRVIARLESFPGEHDVIWAGLEEGIEVEAASLVARGGEVPYTHPRYPDSVRINAGSVYQMQFAGKEQALMADLEGRGSLAHISCAVGPHQVFAPLIGVPYPCLTYRRLRLLCDNGVRHLAQVGGTSPPELVPWDVNMEVLRRFQLDPASAMDEEIAALTRRWAGDELAPALFRAWQLAEESMLAFPGISTDYSGVGFTRHRLWARPLVPNIEAIPPEDREYYEDFCCTTPHNPNNVDLSRDALVQLTTPERSALDVERIDAGVWTPLGEAIALLESSSERARVLLGAANVVSDHLVRLKALRCWFMTQRSVAAWVAGVHGWMRAKTMGARRRHRAALDDMMRKEIANCEALMALLDSGVEFMATTELGETPLMHGRNLKELLQRRIALMERHRGDDPFIDHDYMMRMAGQQME